MKKRDEILDEIMDKLQVIYIVKILKFKIEKNDKYRIYYIQYYVLLRIHLINLS